MHPIVKAISIPIFSSFTTQSHKSWNEFGNEIRYMKTKFEVLNWDVNCFIIIQRKKNIWFFMPKYSILVDWQVTWCVVTLCQVTSGQVTLFTSYLMDKLPYFKSYLMLSYLLTAYLFVQVAFLSGYLLTGYLFGSLTLWQLTFWVFTFLTTGLYS